MSLVIIQNSQSCNWNRRFFNALTGFLESITFTSIKTVLVFYIYSWLNYDKDESSIIFHGFLSLVGVFSLVGAFFADRCFGKSCMILFLLILYATGCIILILATLQITNFTDYGLPSQSAPFVGLLLIALGAGGIKTCVFALTADQYKLPKQARRLSVYLSRLSFIVFGGSLISTAISPVIREFKCYSEEGCFSAVFMLSAIVIIIAIVTFTIGVTKFRNKRPTGDIFSAIDGSINKAIFKNIVFLYLPLSFFWACFEQQGSRWTLQALRMDGEVWGFNIKPDQMQLSYHLLMLVLMPHINYIIYPFLSLFTIRTPLQKIFVGGLFAAAAFVFATFLERDLEKLDPVLPNSTVAQIRVYNGLNCEVNLWSFPNIDNQANITIQSLGMFKADGHVVNVLSPSKLLPQARAEGDFKIGIDWRGFLHEEPQPLAPVIETKYIYLPLEDTNSSLSPDTEPYTGPPTLPPEFACENLSIEKPITKGKAVSYFFRQHLADPFEAHVEKPKLSVPIVRPLVNVPPEAAIISLRDSSKKVTILTPYSTKAITVSRGEVVLFANGLPRTLINTRSGGVYVLLGHRNMTDYEIYHFQIYKTVEPNSIHIVWQLPQYICITLGEMFVTSNVIAFSNSAAPQEMQPILHSSWWLTRAIGNLLAMIIMKIKFFETQSVEYMLFAAIMAILMLIFMILAICYKSTKQDSSNLRRPNGSADWPNELAATSAPRAARRRPSRRSRTSEPRRSSAQSRAPRPRSPN